jgi:alkylation response protein AidB-like acyl-CoA dehydrogenase
MTETLTGPAALTRLAEDEVLFRDSVYEFADKEIRPLSREMDEHAKMPRELIDQLFDLGIMGIEVPESHAGAGASFFHSVLAVEALSRVDPAVGVLVDVQNTLVINAILRWGSEQIKHRHLPRLASSIVGAYCLSEAGSGSDAFALACRAEARGDHFELRGRKLWITNGDEAELFLVFATVDPSAGYKGITCFVVERDTPGFSIGRKEDKLGIRASSTCELIFDAAPVPRENVLGAVGKGYKVAIETLNEGRIGIGAQMVGLAQGALDHAIAYVKTRRQFGKAIGEFQSVSNRIADMKTRLDASRLLVYRIGWLKDRGQPSELEAAMAKLFVSEAYVQSSLDAMRTFGASGYMQELEIEREARDAIGSLFSSGTSDIQRNIIAKKLGLPA